MRRCGRPAAHVRTLIRAAAALLGAGLALSLVHPAHAHGIAGDRLFPATLSIASRTSSASIRRRFMRHR